MANLKNINIISGSNFITGSDGAITSSIIMAKWEIDPADGKSVQFRIPSQSFGGSEDRIPFYVSSSGKIGIGTNNPETEIELKTTSSGTDSHRFGPTRISGSLNVIGNIASGDINGGSF
jgi:hypothetical protein